MLPEAERKIARILKQDFSFAFAHKERGHLCNLLKKIGRDNRGEIREVKTIAYTLLNKSLSSDALADDRNALPAADAGGS